MDVAKAVEESKGGKITYRADKAGNVQAIIGKVSFDADKLVENFKAIHEVMIKSKPATAKGTYMTNLSITTTQGVGIMYRKDFTNFSEIFRRRKRPLLPLIPKDSTNVPPVVKDSTNLSLSTDKK